LSNPTTADFTVTVQGGSIVAMKLVIVGIVLITVGIIGLWSGRTTSNDRERLLEASGERTIPVTRLLGGVALAVGVGFVIVGSRKG